MDQTSINPQNNSAEEQTGKSFAGFMKNLVRKKWFPTVAILLAIALIIVVMVIVSHVNRAKPQPHQYEKVEATEGTIEHYHCPVCGGDFDMNYNKLDSIKAK